MDDENSTSEILHGVDEKTVATEVQRYVNKLFSYTSHLVTFRYNLLIYRLLKRGYVKIGDLADATGFSTSRLYAIVALFEKREIERQENE